MAAKINAPVFSPLPKASHYYPETIHKSSAHPYTPNVVAGLTDLRLGYQAVHIMKINPHMK